MKTPKKFNDNIKRNILTKEMLEACLVSVNKRAKNWRDQERKYRCYREDYYHNVERSRDKKEHYYLEKDKLLSILRPTCIHKELQGYERIRYYEYEDEYYEHEGEYVRKGTIYDRDLGYKVDYGEIENKDYPYYRYYIFYDLGTKHTFHHPIEFEEIEKYNLEIKNIPRLNTVGKSVVDLASTKFVSKVIDLIESEEYKVGKDLYPYIKEEIKEKIEQCEC